MPITAQQAQNSLQGAVNQTAGLTTGQQTFAARLAKLTGLDYRVIGAWLLAEENGTAAASRQAAHNNDWLNIGYTDQGTYGAGDSIWSDPVTAADATASWLQGHSSIPGYGAASPGIQAILSSKSQTPAAQITAIQHSGWASGGYPELPTLYAKVAGSNSVMAQIANAAASPLVAAGTTASAIPNALSSIPAAIADVWDSAVHDAKYAAVLIGLLGLAVMLIYRAFSTGSGGDGRRIVMVPE